MKAPPEVAAHLVALERELLDSSVRKSPRAAELLGESFFEFGSSGRWLDRQEVLQSLGLETPVKVEASEFSVELLAPTVALVTYRCERLAERAESSLRSSLWRLGGGKWKMVFHQATRVS